MASQPFLLAQTAPEKGKKLVAPQAAQGVPAMGPIVREIEIQYAGPKSVNQKVILANMRTTVGQPYSTASVEEDVRNLYATGFFTNLRITDEPEGDGVKVIVIVQPKPLVKEIVLNGYKQLSEKKIKKEIKSKPGDTLSEQQISADADKIKELYQNKGFNKVLVNYKIDVNEEYGRAVVTFNITEGSRAFITEVKFIGNKNLTEKELRKQMKTRKKNLFSFINKSGLFKDDQFKEDLKKLRDYYQGKGYIDMSIKDIKFQYPAKDEMTVVITIFEGIQYSVGKVAFQGEKLFSADQISARLKMKEGSVYSPQGLEADIKAVKDLYGERGYIDADVRPERQANVESGKMDLVYVISEKSQSFVEKIIIQGNNKTKDKVLRRELALAPGEVYDSVRAEASKQRLENLGYFEKVDISAQETSVPNRKNMVVSVQEKRTGSITFGAGFSSVDSLLGFVELSQGNFDISNFPYFTGAGQKFRTRLQYGLRRRDFEVSFTEPWFMNQRLSLGFDLFARDYRQLNSDWYEQDFGASVKLAKALDQFWTAYVQYQFRDVHIYDFSSKVPAALYANEKRWRTESSVTTGLSYDSRDSVFLTRHGEKVNFAVEGAGGPLLGSTDIYRFEADATKYFGLPYDLILSLSGHFETINNYDNTAEVPLFDRLFLGGSRQVRGFDNRDIGPRIANTPSGGKTIVYSNVEMTYPIIDRVRGAFFMDAGVDNSGFGKISPDTVISVGAGVGLRLNLPIGPLRLDFGIPVNYDKYNKSTGKFAFDVGYQF